MPGRFGSLLFLVSLLGLAGCSGGTPFPLVPVAGKITLDGQPLADATVYFQPQAPMGQNLAGPGSFGQTDANGEFKLQTIDGKVGAVVGLHVVRVTTSRAKPASAGSEQAEVIVAEKLPKKYHEESELNFTVPAGGSAAANFDLTSK